MDQQEQSYLIQFANFHDDYLTSQHCPCRQQGRRCGDRDGGVGRLPKSKSRERAMREDLQPLKATAHGNGEPALSPNRYFYQHIGSKFGPIEQPKFCHHSN